MNNTKFLTLFYKEIMQFEEKLVILHLKLQMWKHFG